MTLQFLAKKPWSGFYDISIIQLAHPVPLSRSVNLVCLPDPGEDEHLEDIPITVSGWGVYSEKNLLLKSDVLKSTILRYVEPKSCEKEWGELQMLFNPSIQLCANQPIKKTSSCMGDSGGIHNNLVVWVWVF